jgi:hypothetical protein
MNPGRKLIRNTVFGLWGATALFVGLNRLNATAADGAGITLGLRQEERAEEIPSIDLASASNFTRLSVRGPLVLEVVGAATYEVTLTPISGESPEVRAWLQDRTLHVDAGESQGEARAVLRVQAPLLERIDAGSRKVLVRGLGSPDVDLYMYNGGEARLEQNHVQRWEFFSGNPLAVQLDDATFASGTVKSRGEVSLARAP